MQDKMLRRAGLDYHAMAHVHEHQSLDDFHTKCRVNRLFAFSTKGKRNYTAINYEPGDSLLFGPETRGLSDELLEAMPDGHVLRIPMLETSRSLNLSNTVSIAVFEAWRQNNFSGAID